MPKKERPKTKKQQPKTAKSATNSPTTDVQEASKEEIDPTFPNPPEDSGENLPESWSSFVKTARPQQISSRLARESNAIFSSYSKKLSKYVCLVLFDLESSIGGFDLDRLYAAIQQLNPKRDKDVLLIIVSSGGSIEPAYQISKICRSFAKERFCVAVPRQAKSAATLIALGADEIHMGPLGHLGPIDPQLGGLPALGVVQALKTIASLSEKYPKSAEMFAKYLNSALTVEQIGYCERISESAVQYAERLLLTKPGLAESANDIANDLVHEYKHHGFVIDLDEAYEHLGSGWIKTDTSEVAFAESLYRLFDHVNLFLNVYANKRLLVIGGLQEEDVLVFDRSK